MTNKTKISAAQVARGDLEGLGKQIAAHLKKVRSYETAAHKKAGVELRKANNHLDSISQLLAKVKAQCDGGGFEAFKQKYCPDLGRSRNELLAIGGGRKTIEEARAATRDRVKRHREAHGGGELSVTADVTDKNELADGTAKGKTPAGYKHIPETHGPNPDGSPFDGYQHLKETFKPDGTRFGLKSLPTPPTFERWKNLPGVALDPNEQRKDDGYGTCDYDPTDPRRVESEPYRVTRLRSYLWAAKEAKDLAAKNLFMVINKADWAKLDPNEITDEVIEAAQSAADAWLDVVDKLQRRRKVNA